MTWYMRWGCAAALMALAAPAVVTPLVAQAAAQAAAPDPRLAARLDAPTTVQVQSLVDSAASVGLPGEPLVQKALEGQSKGAEPARIVGAVRILFNSLAEARTALGARAGEADLVAGAASLRAGAAPRFLVELRELRQGRSLVVPLGVLTDLVARGMPVETAWRSVERLARTGASDAEFVSMRERMESDLGASGAAGMPPPPLARPRGVPAAGAPPMP